MNSARRLLLLPLLLAGFAGPVLAAPDRFERTKAHIDALLDRRLKAVPLAAKPANPFLFALAGAVAPVGPVTPDTPPVIGPTAAVLADDDQILAYCVARLRITGQVLRGDVSLLMINANTYRVGDLVPVRGGGDTVYYVKVVRIEPNEVVFSYNDAVLTIALKG